MTKHHLSRCKGNEAYKITNSHQESKTSTKSRKGNEAKSKAFPKSCKEMKQNQGERKLIKSLIYSQYSTMCDIETDTERLDKTESLCKTEKLTSVSI